MSALEILLSVAILGLVFAMTATPLLQYYRHVVFQGASEQALAMLDEARKSTLSSLDSSQYGVHFETSTVTLFKGGTYSAMDSNNDVYTLPAGVTITTITLTGAGSDVVFERVTGETSQNGSVVLEQSGSGESDTIIIHASGLAEM